MIATRRAAWRPGPENGWHDDLVWYAAAIHQMRQLTPGLDEFQQEFLAMRETVDQDERRQRRAAAAAIAVGWSDPMSLGFQSQVHGSYAGSSTWPTRDGRPVLWQECAHNHWFFLPWHRAYLLEFESVVRAHVAQLGGPADDWALPYWNYSDYDGDLVRLDLPLPFRSPEVPADIDVPGLEPDDDGTRPNPLFVGGRLLTEATPSLDAATADAGLALTRAHFANESDTTQTSFGGGVLDSPFTPASFHNWSEIGLLDMQPHGAVHVTVGGYMGSFETAGLDPVFWVHHCNLDRLWETYSRDLGHGYPFESGTDPEGPAADSWRDHQFQFDRPDGVSPPWRAPDLIAVEALGYLYDTTTAPPLPPVREPTPGEDDAPFGIVGGDLAQPAAAADDVALAGELQVRLSASEALPVAGFGDGVTWSVRLDGVRAVAAPETSYLVFVGLGADEATPDTTDPRYVGLLSLFGVLESSPGGGDSAGNGASRRLDATAAVAALGGGYDIAATDVRFVPADPAADLARPGLTMERVAIEFA